MTALLGLGALSMFWIEVDVKRPPAISGGKRGAPTVVHEDVKVLRFMPVDAELRQRLVLTTPYELLQTVTATDVDIREGDTLVYNSEEFPVRAVEDWPWHFNTTARLLVLEELKS